MPNLTNIYDISLMMAMFLADDTYIYEPDKISATSLIKGTKKIILGQRAPKTARDISSNVASSIGTSVHDAVERTSKKYKTILPSLGYKEEFINAIQFNPTEEELKLEGKINIFTEKRVHRKLDDKVTISGTPDIIIDGQLEDIKVTKTYSYTNKAKEKDYILQGSIYRWLVPDLIKNNTIKINFVFVDWSANTGKYRKVYPKFSITQKEYPLLSLEDTEEFIRNKVEEINKLRFSPEDDLPPCDAADLWREPTVWKHFSKPENVKATKIFSNPTEAYEHLDKAKKGVIKEIKGKAKACNYCNAFHICEQKDMLIRAKLLDVI